MATRYRYNSKNKRVVINPLRSKLMTQVMRHKKGKPRPAADAKKAANALRLTLRRGVTKTGRKIKRRSKT